MIVLFSSAILILLIGIIKLFYELLNPPKRPFHNHLQDQYASEKKVVKVKTRNVKTVTDRIHYFDSPEEISNPKD